MIKFISAGMLLVLLGMLCLLPAMANYGYENGSSLTEHPPFQTNN